MIRYPCPHCQMHLEADDDQVGVVLICPGCEQQTIVPNRAAGGSPGSPGNPGSPGGEVPQQEPHIPPAVDQGPPAANVNGVTIPILISAIWNILAGIGWASTCIGIVLTVPLIVLCVFEIILFQKATTMPANELRERAKMIAIFQIIAGLLNGFVSLVCGIIVLVNAGKLLPASSPEHSAPR